MGPNAPHCSPIEAQVGLKAPQCSHSEVFESPGGNSIMTFKDPPGSPGRPKEHQKPQVISKRLNLFSNTLRAKRPANVCPDLSFSRAGDSF